VRAMLESVPTATAATPMRVSRRMWILSSGSVRHGRK
jgi:hypothetical protein